MKMDFLKRRFPDRRDTTLVFSAVMFAVFAYAARDYIYKFPSFILYFNLWDTFGVLAQYLTFALLESLLMTGLIVALAFLLPSAWLRTGFGYKGFITVLVLTAAALYLKAVMTNQPTIRFLVTTVIVSFLAWIGLLFLTRWQSFQRLLLDLADRLTIFLYVFHPLSLLSLAVVAIRLIW